MLLVVEDHRGSLINLNAMSLVKMIRFYLVLCKRLIFLFAANLVRVLLNSGHSIGVEITK
jgi:hypothetical protein